MKKIFRKIFLLAAAVLAMALAGAVSAGAEGHVSINVNPKNAGVGDTITVNVEFSSDNMDIQYAEANLEYNSSIMEVSSDSGIEGSGGVVRLRGYSSDAPTISFAIKFTALAEGNSQLSISNSYATDLSNNSLGSPTASTSVTVGSSDLDPDSTLGSLVVTGGGIMNPPFSPDVTSYTVELPNDVTQVEIQGHTSNVKSYIEFSGGYASVDPIEGTSPKIYSGTVNLSEGDNIRYITVTAENGEETRYTINVIRLASGEDPSQTTTTNASSDPNDPSGISSGEAGTTTAPEDMNIMKNTLSTPYSAPSKGPNDDNMINKIFPFLILGIFVVFIALFVVITWIKMQADKKKRENAHRRKRVQQRKQYNQKQMETYNRTSGQGSRSSYSDTSERKVKANVKKSGSGSNIRKLK